MSGLKDIISQAIEEMISEQGNNYSLERINLGEPERRTGISRSKLRRFKFNHFSQKPHDLAGQKQQTMGHILFTDHLYSLSVFLL